VQQAHPAGHPRQGIHRPGRSALPDTGLRVLPYWCPRQGCATDSSSQSRPEPVSRSAVPCRPSGSLLQRTVPSALPTRVGLSSNPRSRAWPRPGAAPAHSQHKSADLCAVSALSAGIVLRPPRPAVRGSGAAGYHLWWSPPCHQQQRRGRVQRVSQPDRPCDCKGESRG